MAHTMNELRKVLLQLTRWRNNGTWKEWREIEKRENEVRILIPDGWDLWWKESPGGEITYVLVPFSED